MEIRKDLIDAIGNTPLIKLKRASEETGCTILGKAEFMNPGQSVKDRPARQMILEAEKRGEIKPGGLVVESTAGNTGIGLALVANARGYRTLIVIPETQSQEKKDMLRLCGAELIEVPAVPYSNPNNYVKVSGRLAAQLAASEPSGAIWANQFDNVANRDGHLRTTRNQNVLLRDVPVELVGDLRRAVATFGLSLDGADAAADVRACTGSAVCSLAITAAPSRSEATRIKAPASRAESIAEA